MRPHYLPLKTDRHRLRRIPLLHRRIGLLCEGDERRKLRRILREEIDLGCKAEDIGPKRSEFHNLVCVSAANIGIDETLAVQRFREIRISALAREGGRTEPQLKLQSMLLRPSLNDPERSGRRQRSPLENPGNVTASLGGLIEEDREVMFRKIGEVRRRERGADDGVPS